MNKIPSIRCAFTLFELMVTITVIAILISMLIPTIGMIRASAHTVVCASNMRQLGVAMVGYSGDNNGRLIPAVECLIPSGPDTHVWGNSRASWDIRLADFSDGGTVGVTWCPSNTQAQRSVVTSSLSGREWTGRRSYAIPIPYPHGIVTVNPDHKSICVSWWDVEQHTSGSITAARVGDPSGTAMLVESWNFASMGWNNDFGQSWGAGSFSNLDETVYPAYGLTTKHRNRSNTLFCDGHIASTTRQELSNGPGLGEAPYFFRGAWTVMAGD